MSYTRTNIYLLTEDKEKITEIAKKRGMKFSELMRRLMREYINQDK